MAPGGKKVEDQQKEGWQVLCEQAAREENPDRLMKLVAEINRLLGQRFQRKSTDDAA